MARTFLVRKVAKWHLKELIIAKKTAREAGKILLSHFGNLKDVRYKSGRRDPVSEADEASEAYIAKALKEAFPDYGFLGEEKTSWSGKGARWVVDPLDGTVNYAHGLPIFCVSIALERDGESVMGVVYNPVTRELFHAVKGGGAFLNNRPISVSEQKSLGKALVVTGFPYDIDRRADLILGYFGKMVKASQGIRRLGSAALDLCFVAAGRFDGYWELGLKPWDTAAGALIVREAGGKVTDLLGGEFKTEMGEIVAINGKIQKEMLEVLKG